MATGPRWAEPELRRILERGVMIGFHTREPDATGMAGLIAGPFPVPRGVWHVSGNVATLTRNLSLGNAARGGRANTISLWTRDRVFMRSAALREAQQIDAGQPVQIERRQLTVRH